jgi:hypothetical protein
MCYKIAHICLGLAHETVGSFSSQSLQPEYVLERSGRYSKKKNLIANILEVLHLNISSNVGNCVQGMLVALGACVKERNA